MNLYNAREIADRKPVSRLDEAGGWCSRAAQERTFSLARVEHVTASSNEFMPLKEPGMLLSSHGPHDRLSTSMS